MLTHWGRVTHICVSDLTSIGSDNGLSPGRRQAIIWTNAGILLIRPLETNFSEFLVEILIFSFKKMRLKVSSVKRRPFCLGLNELIQLNLSPYGITWPQWIKLLKRHLTVSYGVTIMCMGVHCEQCRGKEQQNIYWGSVLPDRIFVMVAGKSRNAGLCVVMPTSMLPDHLSTRRSNRICNNPPTGRYFQLPYALTICIQWIFLRGILMT